MHNYATISTLYGEATVMVESVQPILGLENAKTYKQNMWLFAVCYLNPQLRNTIDVLWLGLNISPLSSS